MANELLSFLKSYPTKVNSADITDIINFDERLAAVNCLVINIIGVSEEFIEFIPANEPPLTEEILCWAWAIKPNLSKQLLTLHITEGFRVLLHSYLDNDMSGFWNHINTNSNK